MDAAVKKDEDPRSMFQFGSQLWSLEELRDYLNNIRDICAKNIAEPIVKSDEVMSAVCGFYSSGNTVDYISMLCQHWRLLDETKYIALEIFNRFMCSLIAQLHDMIYKKSSAVDRSAKLNRSKEIGHISSDLEAGDALSPEDRNNHSGWLTDENGNSESSHANKEWRETCVHIKTQMKLRAVTAVIIASKVTDHEHIVSLNRAVDILSKQGHCYNKHIIMKSELRILNTVKYNVRLLDSPYPCMMVLLEILCRISSEFNGPQIYEVCIHLLNLYYYFRPKLIAKLSEVHVTRSGLPRLDSEKQAEAFFKTCYDVLKISGTLVCVAVYIHNRELSNLALASLSDIVESDEKSLIHDCCTVLKALLDEEELAR